MEVKSSFGSRLKEIRNNRNLTLDEFSKVVAIPAQTLNRYELGQRTPKMDVVFALAEKLQVNPVWLSGHEVVKDDELIVLTKYLMSIGYSFEYVYAKEVDGVLEEQSNPVYDSNGNLNLQLPLNKKRLPCIRKGNSSTILTNEQFKEFNNTIKHAVDYELSKFMQK